MSYARQSGLLLLCAPLTVAAQADSLRRGIALPAIVITGVLLPTATTALGFSVTTLRLDPLRHGPAADAARTVSALAGMAVDASAGVNGPTNLSLRGATEQYTQVLSDGLPLNLSGGFLDLAGLTLVNVERLEVARGPQSLVHGSAAVAGAVRFVTRHGRRGPLRASVTAEGGSGVTRGATSRVEALADGGTEVLQISAGAGMAYDRGIYQLPHDLWSREGSIRLDAQPTTRLELTATARYTDVDALLPVRNPGVSRAPLDPNQRNARDRLLISLVTNLGAQDTWRHSITLGATRDDGLYEDQFDDIASTMSFPFFIADFDLTVRSVLQRLVAGYDGHVRTGRVTWAYGTRIEREDVRNEQGGQFGDAESTFDRAQRAAYAEVSADGDRLHARLGVRVEGIDGLRTAWTPRTALALTVVQGLQLQASVGHAFKAPNIQQQFFASPNHLPNPDLRPETSWAVEGGAVLSSRAGSQIGIAIYHQWYADVIRTVPVDSLTRTNSNIGTSRAWGVEVSAHGRLTPTVHWTVVGARMITRLDDHTGLAPALFPVGQPLPGPPTAMARFSLDGRRDRLAWGAGLRALGERLVLSERFAGTRERLDPHILLDFRLALEVRPTLTVYGRAENVLNTNYDVAFDRPGRPLTVVVGIRAGR